jgi:hypothetical protein
MFERLKVCLLPTHLFFGIDAQARDQGLSQQDRQLLRLEKSKRLLEQIKTQIQTARSDAQSSSILATMPMALWSLAIKAWPVIG